MKILTTYSWGKKKKCQTKFIPPEALAGERGSEEKIWGSMVKQTLKRRRPGFNESY